MLEPKWLRTGMLPLSLLCKCLRRGLQKRSERRTAVRADGSTRHVHLVENTTIGARHAPSLARIDDGQTHMEDAEHARGRTRVAILNRFARKFRMISCRHGAKVCLPTQTQPKDRQGMRCGCAAACFVGACCVGCRRRPRRPVRLQSAGRSLPHQVENTRTSFASSITSNHRRMIEEISSKHLRIIAKCVASSPNSRRACVEKSPILCRSGVEISSN